VATTTISLPDDQVARPRLHALSSRRSLDEVVREAVGAYLAQLPESATPRVIEPPPGPRSPEWQARFDAALARIRAQVPPDMTPEAIEAEITAAADEARQERRENGAADRRARVIEPKRRPRDPAWQAEIQKELARLRSQVPPDMTPEGIEAEIDAAWQEVRRERRARRGLND
jgi:hypothetical protein